MRLIAGLVGRDENTAIARYDAFFGLIFLTSGVCVLWTYLRGNKLSEVVKIAV